MRKYLSDRNLVIVLFILVLITFSLAHEDSKKLQQFSTQQTISSENSFSGPHKKIVQVTSAAEEKNTTGTISR